MTLIAFVVGVSVGFMLAVLLGWYIDTQRRADAPEYETVTRPEREPSLN